MGTAGVAGAACAAGAVDTVATAGAVDDAADGAQVFDNISDGFSYGDDDEDDITEHQEAWLERSQLGHVL